MVRQWEEGKKAQDREICWRVGAGCEQEAQGSQESRGRGEEQMLSSGRGRRLRRRPFKVPTIELLPRALAGCYQGLRGPACVVTLSWKLKQTLEAKAEQGEAIKEQLKANSLWFSAMAAQ